MKAPVIVFAYNRPDKLERCLNSLETNAEAGETDLFVFSDGAKNDADRSKVDQVRDLLEKYKGKTTFKDIKITSREKNCGLATSIITGVSDVISRYGKVIVVEDDLVVSRYFLKFMNESLDFYEGFDEIWAVGGYTPELKVLRKYPHDIYVNYRATSEGWAMWKNRWDTVIWDMDKINGIISDSVVLERFKRGGNDLPVMLRLQGEGKIDSWAIRWNFSQAYQDKLAIAPCRTLVHNIGFDGTGVHSKSNGRLVLDEEDIERVVNKKSDFRFEKLKPDRSIIHAFYYEYSDTIWKKIKRRLPW